MTEIEELKCLSELNKNSEWIASRYEEIREVYAGKFIAVKDLSVIENDENVNDLLNRLYARDENIDCIAVEFVPPRNLMIIL